MNSFEPLTKPWLEVYHINKYVKKTDFREFNRPSRMGRDSGTGPAKSVSRAEFFMKRRQKALDSRRYSFNVIDVE